MAAFHADAEITQLLSELGARGAAPGLRISYLHDAQAIRDETFDLEALRAKGYAYERLDQLTMELLLGVR